jgi:hypothetical protein
MFCTKCGKKLNDNAKFCTQCGTVVKLATQLQDKQEKLLQSMTKSLPQYPQYTNQYPIPFQQQININMPQQQIIQKTKWETPRLVIGIITIVLFFLLQFQSCVASFGESLRSILSDEAGTSGMTGYICSFFFLIAGIVGIVCRKRKSGAIAAGIIYAICGFATINEDFSYFKDLAFYCFLSFVFGGIMIIGGVIQKKNVVV